MGCDARRRAHCQQSKGLIRPWLGRESGSTEGGWEAAAFPSAKVSFLAIFAQKSQLRNSQHSCHIQGRKSRGWDAEFSAELTSQMRATGEGSKRDPDARSHPDQKRLHPKGMLYLAYPCACPKETAWKWDWQAWGAYGAPPTGGARPAR